jgi:hypothetical protein
LAFASSKTCITIEKAEYRCAKLHALIYTAVFTVRNFTMLTIISDLLCYLVGYETDLLLQYCACSESATTLLDLISGVPEMHFLYLQIVTADCGAVGMKTLVVAFLGPEFQKWHFQLLLSLVI